MADVDLLERARTVPDGRLVSGAPFPVAERVAVLPASFDPPTVGHAALADAALQEGSVVVLLYSVRTLPKEGEPGAPLLSEVDRVRAMEALAATRPGAVVAVTSASLLVDQAEAAATAFPGAQVELLAGSDKVIQVVDPRWYDDPDDAVERLFAAATVRYALREGDDAGEIRRIAERWPGRLVPIDVDPAVTAVSSRDVRERLRRGRDVSALAPPEVMPFLPSSS
jgi:nicotinic acid mononucleotide adenylyltransferase